MTNNTIRANTGTYGTSDTAAIGPLMQGQAGVVMTFTLTDLGGAAVNLTGLTITGTITNNQTKATAALQGAIALVTPASGIFSWTPHEDDVGTAGSFKVIFTVGSTLITLPAHLAIIETPAATTTFGAALVGVTVAEAAWLAAALAALPDAGDLANVPDPAGATASYVWTADGADGADWAAAAGGGASDVGDLTTTSGNSTEMLRVAAAGGLEYRTPAQVLGDIGAAASSSLANYLPLAGGTMSGNIAMSGAQTVDGVDVSALGSTVSGHVGNTSNPHSVTAAQVSALPLAGGTLTGAVVMTPGSGAALTINPASGQIGLQINSTSNFPLQVQGNGTAAQFTSGTTGTNTITRLLSFIVKGGTTTTGFGGGMYWYLKSSTTDATDAGRIVVAWYEATHASRKADMVLYVNDASAEREGLRVRANGSAPAIGFLGATPAARVAHVADPSGGATVDAEARSAINSILATLETFGFHATS